MFILQFARIVNMCVAGCRNQRQFPGARPTLDGSFALHGGGAAGVALGVHELQRAAGARVAPAAARAVVGDAALFFDPADVGGMAATLDRLLEDAELRRELGARALANSGDFSWPKTAARTLDVLKEAAQRPSPGR